MKINGFADVCLRTLMLLAAAPGEQLTSREISERIGIPYNHVSKAVLELRRRGALDVARGRTGGARITEAGLQLSVGALLRSLDGHQDPVECITSDGVACPLIAACRLRSALHRAREAFYATLDDLTVESLSVAPSFVGLPMPTRREASLDR
ncbi:RrF2 family transcriptional regulator [Agromyces sp. NPDC058136]|uniref:RrF2 family transcriptional regulator n=1 Tax=Agromyces sp. NPDC058136 TaxID=3346354 RepID=UPI0036DC6545